MFDQIFKKQLARRRMAASHLSIILEPFVSALCERGHVIGSIQMYVQAIEHFGRWLKAKGILSAVTQIDPPGVEINGFKLTHPEVMPEGC